MRESTSNGNGWYNSDAEDEDQDAGQETQEGQDDDDGRLSVSSSSQHNTNNSINGGKVCCGLLRMKCFPHLLYQKTDYNLICLTRPTNTLHSLRFTIVG